MPQLLKFNTPYKTLSPDTIFLADSGTRTLQPFGSGEALTERGFNFGQVEIGAPDAFGDYGLGSIINSRSQSLAGVKTELNQFQNDTFSQGNEPKKRASSVLEDSISADQKSLDDALAEYKGLKDKLGALAAPNYQQAYTDLRTSAGVPALEQQFTDTRANRRELPYTERANTGNAAVATEAQLGAQTAEKDIPLGVKEANLIDRLQLASDFVSNSLKFKQMDSESARSSITDAASLLSDTINMTRAHLSDLTATKDKQQARADTALEFNIKNNINTPAFLVGSQAYDARTLTPISLEQYQSLTGQQVGLSEKETSFGPTLLTKIDAGKQEEKGLVMDLISSYPDAGIMPNDSFVVASSKIKDSRIYQDKVRGPVGTTGPGALTDVDIYAQQLYNGSLKPNQLTGTTAFKAQVLAKFEDLKKNASQKYTTEFDARLDYDRDIQELSRDLQDPSVQLPSPTSIIQQLINDYGSRVSKQEIEGTVLNIFGHNQRPKPSVPGVPQNIADRGETLSQK